MKAVILAGGKGTRLYPLTEEIPKHLLTVKRKPIVNHLLELFSSHGVSQPMLIVNYEHYDVYLKWLEDNINIAANVAIFREPKPMGTFGGLRLLQSRLTDTFIVSNGDELKDFNISKIIDFHKSKGAVATIALVKIDDPSQYGVPVMEGDRIVRFLEKPSVRKSRISGGRSKDSSLKKTAESWVSSGLYIVEPDVFSYIKQEKSFLMFEKDVFPKLAFAGKLYGYKVKEGRWQDCGTFERWEKAIREW